MSKELTLDNEFFSNKTIALAISGGRDSMAMLHLFETSSLDFFVVNIEHGIRDENSKKDSAFVQTYCSQKNIRCFSHNVDALQFAKQNHLSVEQSARELRYSIFDFYLQSKQCDFVATAHHLDDQCETILMRICRGTGIFGLQGISQQRNGYIRPLLNFSREDIDNYVKSNNIPFVDDETNFCDEPTRNFLRINIFPKLKERFPQIESAFQTLSKNASEMADFTNSLAKQPIKVDENSFLISVPFSASPIFKREVVVCANCLGVFQDFENVNFEDLEKLQTAKNSTKINLPHNLIAIKQPNGILMFKDCPQIEFFKKFEDVLSELQNENSVCVAGITFLKSQPVEPHLKFDVDKIPENSVFRNRTNGDKISKFGGGTKSLGDFLTDKKIPVRQRENMIVLANQNDVLLVHNIEISNKIKTDDKTTNILFVLKERTR